MKTKLITLQTTIDAIRYNAYDVEKNVGSQTFRITCPNGELLFSHASPKSICAFAIGMAEGLKIAISDLKE
jgi:hypothetical protein